MRVPLLRSVRTVTEDDAVSPSQLASNSSEAPAAPEGVTDPGDRVGPGGQEGPRERSSTAVGGSTTIEDTVEDTALADRVQQTLQRYLRSRRAECGELDHDFAEAVDGLVEFVLRGGKRIRPTFAWWGWRAAGGAERGEQAEAMLRAASSLELVQACALVHDDLIDDSWIRRGNPSMHKEFAEVHRRRGFSGGADQFGTAAAILLGDLSLSWADDMLHQAGLAPEALSRALAPWRAMRTEVLAGQYLDVLGQVRGDEDPEAAMRTGQLKAASYTVRRPIELGAAAGGADQRLQAALRRFGSDVGVAFQLRDDLLGVFGDPDVTGKPAGDDLREGKRTLLISKGLETAQARGDQQAAELVRGALGDPDVDESTVQRVRSTLTRLGAVDAVEERIAELTRTGLAALRSAEVAEPAAGRLAELAVEVTDRNR